LKERELRVVVNKERGTLAIEGIDAVTCREKLGGQVDFGGRCVLRVERLEEER